MGCSALITVALSFWMSGVKGCRRFPCTSVASEDRVVMRVRPVEAIGVKHKQAATKCEAQSLFLTIWDRHQNQCQRIDLLNARFLWRPRGFARNRDFTTADRVAQSGAVLDKRPLSRFSFRLKYFRCWWLTCSLRGDNYDPLVPGPYHWAAPDANAQAVVEGEHYAGSGNAVYGICRVQRPSAYRENSVDGFNVMTGTYYQGHCFTTRRTAAASAKSSTSSTKTDCPAGRDHVYLVEVRWSRSPRKRTTRSRRC